MHSREESLHEPRVPNGVDYSSLSARLRSVNVTLMNRFLLELQTYTTGACTLDWAMQV